MDIVLMVTRSDLQLVQLRKSITRIMWQNVWKSELFSEQHQDAIFFTAWLAERTSARLLQECHCAPVTAHETANVSELLDMAGRIWRDSILRSESCIPLRHFSRCVLSACVVSTHET